MNAIVLKKGFSPRIAGAPDRQLRQLEAPRHVGVLPEHIPFIKPRLLVAEGDAVAIGTPLFEDKRNVRIRFLSPGGGRVTRIIFGPRRIIQQIVIDVDNDEAVEPMDVPAPDQLATLPRQAVVDALLDGGMWPFIRSLPFMDLADPAVIPPAIIVRLGDDEPFAPQPVVYLKDRDDYFTAGMDLLRHLCGRVVINLVGDAAVAASLPGQDPVQRFAGRYPAGNPSVQLYRSRSSPDHLSWSNTTNTQTQRG